MSRSGKVMRIVAMLVALLLVFCVAAMAESASDDPSGAMFLKTDTDDLHAQYLMEFKAKLNELGFYVSGVSENVLNSPELDNVTMAAVLQVINLNPDLTYYADGISNMLYWRVMGKGGYDPVVTPNTAIYQDIAIGDESDAVRKIQDRLNRLGYDAAGFEFKPGVYDDALQRVINAFVDCNKMNYDEEGVITAELQEMLFSDEAITYTAPEEEKKSLSDKVFGWMSSSTKLAGLSIPNGVMLGVGFVLLCAIIVLIVMLTSPKSNGVKKKANEIAFKVEYGGESYVHRVSNKGCIRIGRETGDFPMNMSDTSVSRKHCEIYYDKSALMLRDFSTYGTKINGEECHHGQHVLHSGDTIEIGQHKITITF